MPERNPPRISKQDTARAGKPRRMRPRPTPANKAIGRRLREARRLAGFDSAGDLARHISREMGSTVAGYSESLLYDMERGEKPLPRDKAEFLGKFLARDADWFYEGTGPPPPETDEGERLDRLERAMLEMRELLESALDEFRRRPPDGD